MPKVASKIDAVIRQFYRPAEETGHVVEYSDNTQYWADGETAAEIIQGITGADPPVADAVDAYLSAAEWHDVKDGDDAYYGDILLEHVDVYPDEFMSIWLHLEERLKHEVRFFDEDGKRILDELFADLPSLSGGKAIVTIEPSGESTFYRARIVDHDADVQAFMHDPAREIGPPQPHLARAGRMNPVGIPVFYGAFSQEVAVAEVRPPVGAVVAVGKFSLLRTVRLLDVSFLPFAYHEESIFSPAYDRLRNKVGFLEKLHRRISRPVLPSDEALDYLPTQAVAAYIANVMGLNGMIYGSTQIGSDRDSLQQVDRMSCNIVLFGEAARVEGTNPKPNAADHPTPRIVGPNLGAAGDPSELMALLDPSAYGLTATPSARQPVQEPVMDVTTVPRPEASPASASGAATLRVESQPTLVRIRSVKVETSSIFSYLHEDGRVILVDPEDNDD